MQSAGLQLAAVNAGYVCLLQHNSWLQGYGCKTHRSFVSQQSMLCQLPAASTPASFSRRQLQLYLELPCRPAMELSCCKHTCTPAFMHNSSNALQKKA
jgi:hypothetical protein